MTPGEVAVHRIEAGGPRSGPDPDPITTEIVRHLLNPAANQMKRVLMRTAFSLVIYEVLVACPRLVVQRLS